MKGSVRTRLVYPYRLINDSTFRRLPLIIWCRASKGRFSTSHFFVHTSFQVSSKYRMGPHEPLPTFSIPDEWYRPTVDGRRSTVRIPKCRLDPKDSSRHSGTRLLTEARILLDICLLLSHSAANRPLLHRTQVLLTVVRPCSPGLGSRSFRNF